MDLMIYLTMDGMAFILYVDMSSFQLFVFIIAVFKSFLVDRIFNYIAWEALFKMKFHKDCIVILKIEQKKSE